MNHITEARGLKVRVIANWRKLVSIDSERIVGVQLDFDGGLCDEQGVLSMRVYINFM